VNSGWIADFIMRLDRVPFRRREELEQISFVGFGQSPISEIMVVDVVV